MHPTADQHQLQLKDDQSNKRTDILRIRLLEGFDVVFLLVLFMFKILRSKANVHDRSYQAIIG